MKKINIKLLIPILNYILLTLYFVNILPFLDGNIDFVQATDFYLGGFKQYFENWNTIHPPLKIALYYPLFILFGPSTLIYNLIGILFGIMGIISIYLLTKKLSNENAAFLAAIFLSISPLFLSNTIFTMRDLMLTSLILLSLYFYSIKKYFFYSLSISLAILTKETGLLIPISILITELIYLFTKFNKINKSYIKNIIPLLIPFIFYFLWKLFLKMNDKNSWSEWIFTNNENKSAFYTIFNNLLTFEFINPYAQAHLKQLVYLNFNWIYILIILSIFIFSAFKYGLKINSNSETFKTSFSIILFIILYILTVLTLQTYTIPRYALPMIPFLLIALAISITQVKIKLINYLLSIVVISLMILSIFTSIDPIAKKIWGITNVFNHNIYSLNEHMAGNDGMTYNLEYLFIAKERSDLIKNTDSSNRIISDYCSWIFLDPNNEIKMFKLLNIKTNITCNNY